MSRAVTCTTRLPRKANRMALIMTFGTAGSFLKRVQAGNFLEHATVYGTATALSSPKCSVNCAKGKDVLLSVDVQGAASIRQRAEEG